MKKKMILFRWNPKGGNFPQQFHFHWIFAMGRLISGLMGKSAIDGLLLQLFLFVISDSQQWFQVKAVTDFKRPPQCQRRQVN